MCMSRQPPQPLIWLARIFTSSSVADGMAESSTAFPALMRWPSALTPTGLFMTFNRASIVFPASAVLSHCSALTPL